MGALPAVKEIVGQAEQMGWEVDRDSGGHIKLTPKSGGAPVTISTTMDDRGRNAANLKTRLNKAGFFTDWLAFNAEQETKRDANLKAELQRGQRLLDEAAARVASGQGFAHGPHGIVPSAERLTVPMLRAMLDRATSDPTFIQRPLKAIDLLRWRARFKSGKFMEYVPDGPFCFDPAGFMMNGRHRATSAVDAEVESIGVWVFRNVPRSMYPYFDMPRVRTAGDVFTISGRKSSPVIDSTVRLGYWYDQMLEGNVPADSWPRWQWDKVDPPDLDAFYAEVEDWAAKRPDRQGIEAAVAQTARVRRGQILPTSAAVFWFYALRAWPEGELELRRFVDTIVDGGKRGSSSAVVLRDWALDIAAKRKRIMNKREVHLLLLLHAWRQWNAGSCWDRVSYSPNWTMPQPYVPATQSGQAAELPKTKRRR